MLLTINDFGRKVTALFEAGQYCTFAPPEETLGVIDTSPEHDGSRGIAFLCDEIRTNFGGIISRVGYKQVCSVRIVKSYETTFDDELEIEAPNACIRITDCSLNKFFLKQLINSMCRIYYTMREEKRLEMHAQCTAAAAEHFAGEIPVINVQLPEEAPTKPVEKEQQKIVPVEIPDGKIQWLSNGATEPEKGPKQVAEDKPEPIKGEIPSEVPKQNNDDLSAIEDDLPEDMSRDEALSYLVSSINEINSDGDDDFDDDLSEELQPVAVSAAAISQPETAPVESTPVAEEQPPAEPELPSLGLTEEPASDDIYIKASRRLRQYCEERLMTMEEIENEVKQNMVSVAESYSALSAEGNIPRSIELRVETLKNATDSLPEYFALGEDIAARVMFFMLYQMLSYSDRIAEQPETKERLNDFFRRYGSAGMALSLLDSGI